MAGLRPSQQQKVLIGAVLLLFVLVPALVVLRALPPTTDEGSQVGRESDIARSSGNRGMVGDITGFYDVQCTGELRDYCRFVVIADGSSFFSCALHGAAVVYTAPGQIVPTSFDAHRVLKACDLGHVGATIDATAAEPQPLPQPQPAAGPKGHGGVVTAALARVTGWVHSPPAAPLPTPHPSAFTETQIEEGWAPVQYVISKVKRGYDAHEPSVGPAWRCKAVGDGIRLVGGIQCTHGKEDCFLRSELDLTGEGVFVVAATLPQQCRPATLQHLYMHASWRAKVLPGPGILVLLNPSGEVTIELDPGAQEWSMLVDAVSEPGPGLSKLTVTIDEPPTVSNVVANKDRPIVVIGVPMTSRKITIRAVEQSPLWRLVIPSLKRSLTTDLDKYRVIVVAGYDKTDAYWHPTNPQNKMDGRIQIDYKECDCDNMVCNSNCVMRHGYEAGADFFFRINDDSEMKQSQNWITRFVDTLAAFDPPYIGVVGPLCKQGKISILTHDFVHRSHMEIFGLHYYPPILKNWWCDDWVSLVYGEVRTRVIREVPLHHHTSTARYKVDFTLKQESGAFGKMLRETRALASAVVR